MGGFSACHQVGADAANRVGPALNGIVGAPVGGAEGFRYSATLEDAAAAGDVWTHEALSGFLANPKGYYPKTKMSFPGLRDAADVEAVIAYLATFEG